MRSIVVGAAVVLALAACQSATGVDRSQNQTLAQEQNQSLDQYQTLWNQSDPHSYSFVYDVINLGFRETVRITVLNDVVTSVVDVSTGESASLQYPWPTVDGIFAIAHQGLDSDQTLVDAQFDAHFGFPSVLKVGPRFNSPAGFYQSIISSFQPIE